MARAGDYSFRVRLTQGGRVLDETHYDLSVSVAPTRRSARFRAPGFLVSRVYEFGSLTRTADGFSLRLHNLALPVRVQRLVELRVDGTLIDPAQVQVIRGGISRRVSSISPETPLEISSAEHITIAILNYALTPGAHEFEAGAEFLGLGEIAARWSDRLV